MRTAGVRETTGHTGSPWKKKVISQRGYHILSETAAAVVDSTSR